MWEEWRITVWQRSQEIVAHRECAVEAAEETVERKSHQSPSALTSGRTGVSLQKRRRRRRFTMHGPMHIKLIDTFYFICIVTFSCRFTIQNTLCASLYTNVFHLPHPVSSPLSGITVGLHMKQDQLRSSSQCYFLQSSVSASQDRMYISFSPHSGW